MRQLKKRLRLALRRGASRWLGHDRDRQIIDTYLAGAGPKRLQIGCGRRYLEGWLNSDYHPKTRDVLHLDATARLPFEEGMFDTVFSEHMIEHVPFPQGWALIHECFRVLAPGGVLRLSTPDLAFLVDLYRPGKPGEPDRTLLQKEFIEHFLATEIKDRDHNAPVDLDSFLINKFVRAWGHEFIYDEKTLRFVLESAGFADIVRCEIMQSEHEELSGLEHETRKPPGHLGLESVILEGTRPTTAG